MENCEMSEMKRAVILQKGGSACRVSRRSGGNSAAIGNNRIC